MTPSLSSSAEFKLYTCTKATAWYLLLNFCLVYWAELVHISVIIMPHCALIPQDFQEYRIMASCSFIRLFHSYSRCWSILFADLAAFNMHTKLLRWTWMFGLKKWFLNSRHLTPTFWKIAQIINISKWEFVQQKISFRDFYVLTALYNSSLLSNLMLLQRHYTTSLSECRYSFCTNVVLHFLWSLHKSVFTIIFI